MAMRRFLTRPVLLCALAAPLPACLSVAPDMSATSALPDDASGEAMALAALRDEMRADGTSEPIKALVAETTAIAPLMGQGRAQVARQPGSSLNEKRLMAIRAARLDALRDLTEQVHGIALESETTLRDTVVRNDSLRILVEGEIRGARTARITPKGNDSYEVVLTLDPDVVAYIARAAQLGI